MRFSLNQEIQAFFSSKKQSFHLLHKVAVPLFRKAAAACPLSRGVAIRLSLGLGFLLTWYVTAILRTSLVLNLGNFSLPWSQIPKVSLSLFAPELVLFFLVILMELIVTGIPLVGFVPKEGFHTMREIFKMEFFYSMRKTLLVVCAGTSFVLLLFVLLKPVKNQRYHESFVAEMATGPTARSIFLPDRVLDISRGVKVPETVRALIDSIALGHLSMAALLFVVFLRRLMNFLKGIDYAPTIWGQRPEKWPVPRAGGRSSRI